MDHTKKIHIEQKRKRQNELKSMCRHILSEIRCCYSGFSHLVCIHEHNKGMKLRISLKYYLKIDPSIIKHHLSWIFNFKRRSSHGLGLFYYNHSHFIYGTRAEQQQKKNNNSQIKSLLCDAYDLSCFFVLEIYLFCRWKHYRQI